RGSDDRPEGAQGRLCDPPEPPRYRQRQRRPQPALVPQPAFAVVQDPPSDGAAAVPDGAGVQPRGPGAGLGPVGRLGDRRGRAAGPVRPGRRPRRDPDPLAPRFVPEAPPPGAEPRQGSVPPAGLVRRSGQQPRPLARASPADRALHAPPSGARPEERPPPGPPGPPPPIPARLVIFRDKPLVR